MKERDIVFWGAGVMCQNILMNTDLYKPLFIIDKNKEKTGNKICNIEIKHYDDIPNLNEYYIIITSQYEKEIMMQLDSFGLKHHTDYLSINELYRQPIEMSLIQQFIEEESFGNDSANKEIFEQISGISEYEALKNAHEANLKYEKMLSRIYRKLPYKIGMYRAKCACCNEIVNIQVDYYWSTSDEPAWRETVVCPKCNCNSRMRFIVDLVSSGRTEKKIYCYERTTCTYKALSKIVKNLTGSEYLGVKYKSGDVVDGIMHQDAMNLSFEDDTFDVMISCDVFEHVADPQKALREAYRCLKKGGELLVSIPVFLDRENSVVRSVLTENGEIENLLPAVYHGNPLSCEGSLVFTEFGWDFIESLKNAGFTESYAICYSSVEKGYFGNMPIVFRAVK